MSVVVHTAHRTCGIGLLMFRPQLPDNRQAQRKLRSSRYPDFSGSMS
jgi:hypothetical protein